MGGCLSFSRRKGAVEQETFRHSEVGRKLIKYSYEELRKVTGDFKLDNEVGRGGFGSVFMGTFSDGTIIAVKVLSSASIQGEKEFLAEINAISYIVHDNLVKLNGVCTESNKKIIVYEYLENKSLAQTLLGANSRKIQFTWKIRCKICIGVARGLAFLHEEVNPHIVHRDIKASNILLDKDLTPKISDFGLAKLLPPEVTHISTGVAGTRGYLAPEYANSGHVTRKSDVYSFGVLLLEIVSGRCNTNTRLPDGDDFLLVEVWALYQQGDLKSIIDATLSDDLNIEEACLFLKVGLLCTQAASKLRPTMSTVVKMLTGEADVDLTNITKPDLVSDFMEPNVTRKMENDTYGTFTYTAIEDRE